MPLNLMGMKGPRGEVLLVGIVHGGAAQLAPHAIVGEADVVNGTPVWSTFRRNRTFLDFYVRYMRGQLSVQPEALRGPPVKPGEFVYVIDQRAETPRGDVPFQEIVGWYKSTADGKPDAPTFEYNKEHAFVRPDGKISKTLGDPKLERAIASVV